MADSYDLLLPYYERELVFLRQMGQSLPQNIRRLRAVSYWKPTGVKIPMLNDSFRPLPFWPDASSIS